MNLAITGAIKDDILDIEQISKSLLSFLSKNYPNNLAARYGLENTELSPDELLLKICDTRKFIKTGGEADILKASIIILDEFRSGMLGKISLETPNDF